MSGPRSDMARLAAANGVSYMRQWRVTMALAGRCQRCGRLLGERRGSRCTPCVETQNQRQRVYRANKCSACGIYGHNRRTCMAAARAIA